ncbi:uncharacterized protein EI90DRAFT_2834224, partial [Cantharellus anzutake]|uniref:uncharacterized protein n=1 Tax=Cantharellus anzutake TaxID=1750568 RepID=UPI0019065D49
KDESRLQKRKEQNRAAQRAFRERKNAMSKRYLEDQLAVLEAKSKNQDLENTSLRELLSRLQNENLVLK